MAQHDYDIANQSHTAFRADLNNALGAIVSQNSGATEPSTKFAYQWWADTTTGTLKIRNAANSAWIIVGTLADLNLGLSPISAFSAYISSTTTLTTATETKILYASESFDANSDFSSSRHTPLKAGKYLYIASFAMDTVADGTYCYMRFRKNGNNHKMGAGLIVGAAGSPRITGACIASMNGSSDYMEVFGYHNHGSNRDTVNDSTCSFEGYRFDNVT